MRVCLNFICKNEAKIIRRMLDSVRDVIDCVVAVDTGSTDGTVPLIESWCIENGKSRDVHRIRFENFEQARNEALRLCRESDLKFDYILLLDADFISVGKLPELTAQVYSVTIKGGGISYRRPQLIRRHLGVEYVGATHEYLALPTHAVNLDGFHIEDLGDGGSKADKYERDIRLLREDLRKNPDNARSMYYLAESYRNSGHFADAALWYGRRTQAAGWDEEAWHAAYMKAICERELKNETAFVRDCWTAYGMRSWRSEPLYHLAKYWREQGRNEQAMAICEIGRNIPYPHADSLFVEDSIYEWGWLEEQSIVGFYCREKSRFEAGREACRALARGNFGRASDLARQNLRFYDKPTAAKCAPLVKAKWMKQFDFPRRPGWSLFNPTILARGDEMLAIVRSSNYEISGGSYIVADADRVVRTENYLLRKPHGSDWLDPIRITPPKYPTRPHNVTGLEDCRLFERDGNVYVSATIRDHAEGGPRIGFCEIDPIAGNCGLLKCPSEPFPGTCEKNWMPVQGPPLWMYAASKEGFALWASGPIRGEWDIGRFGKEASPMRVPNARGGGQVVPFDSGWLAIVHEANDDGARTYTHRFLWYDADWKLTHASEPFGFREQPAIEFAAGLAVVPDGIWVSFGVRDAEAWLCSIDPDEVRTMLGLPAKEIVIEDRFGKFVLPNDGYAKDAIYRPVCEWDEYKFADLAKEFPDVRVILDFGASHGTATRMLRHYWPQAHVMAFEPDSLRMWYLARNCPGIHCWSDPVVGFWPDRERALKGIGWGEPWRSSPEEAIDQPKTALGAPNASIRFDRAISAAEAVKEFERIDLLKIDVEGFELGILQELSEIGKLPRVIVGEWHFRNCLDGLRALLEPTHDFQWIEPAEGAGPWQLFWARRKDGGQSQLA